MSKIKHVYLEGVKPIEISVDKALSGTDKQVCYKLYYTDEKLPVLPNTTGKWHIKYK